MDEVNKFLANTIGKVSALLGGTIAVGIYIGWHFMGGFRKGWKDRKLQRVYKRSDITNRGILSINSYCSEIKGKIDVDRVNVFTYSNGIQDKTGLCYDFVSTIGEAKKEGVESMFDKIQGMPINPQTRDIIDRIQKSEINYLRLSQTEAVGEQKLLLRDYGIETSYNFKLGENVWEGVLTLSWSNAIRILTPEEIEEMQFVAYQIHQIKKSIAKK